VVEARLVAEAPQVVGPEVEEAVEAPQVVGPEARAAEATAPSTTRIPSGPIPSAPRSPR
jgi:hypothetical protein